MMGNASEWVDSWFGPYGSNDVYDGIPSRVQRGGSWNIGEREGNTTYRYHGLPAFSTNGTGFRCAMDVE